MSIFVGAWNKRENRRRFFEDYATSCGFDPLKPSNWYNQSRTLIMASKVPFPSFSFFSVLSFLLFPLFWLFTVKTKIGCTYGNDVSWG